MNVNYGNIQKDLSWRIVRTEFVLLFIVVIVIHNFMSDESNIVDMIAYSFFSV